MLARFVPSVLTGTISVCFMQGWMQKTIFAELQVQKTDWKTLELSMSNAFSKRMIVWQDA